MELKLPRKIQYTLACTKINVRIVQLMFFVEIYNFKKWTHTIFKIKTASHSVSQQVDARHYGSAGGDTRICTDRINGHQVEVQIFKKHAKDRGSRREW